MKLLRRTIALVVNGFKGRKISGQRDPKVTLRRALAVVFLLMFVGSLASYASDDLELIQAAAIGDIAKVTTWLAQGAKVNAKNNFGFTALMSTPANASVNGHSEIVKLLKKAGAKE